MRISFRLNAGDIRLERGGVKEAGIRETGYGKRGGSAIAFLRTGMGVALAISASPDPGSHQHGTKAYLHFVVLAIGSLAEAETQLEIARRLRMASDDELEAVTAVAIRARQLLLGLRRSLAART